MHKHEDKQSLKPVILDVDLIRRRTIANAASLYEKAAAELTEEDAKIFKAYKMILEDDFMFAPIKKDIAAGMGTVEAIEKNCLILAESFSSMKQKYMQQRAEDILQILKMMKDAAYGHDCSNLNPEGTDKFIILADNLGPADTMGYDKSRLAGIAVRLGGATSHTVILSKSMGIPCVVSIKALEQEMDDIKNGETAILDGTEGVLIRNPDSTLLAEYSYKSSAEDAFKTKVLNHNSTVTKTKDKHRVLVSANVNEKEEIGQLLYHKTDGVGLFRTEFLYMGDSQPSFTQQLETYKKILEICAPNTVTIRTADIGGDKIIPFLNITREENPFLGNRGIRLCLNHEKMFKTQLKALMAASSFGKLDIMLPMITEFKEITRTEKLIEDVRKELAEEKTKLGNYRLGIMAETPAAAILADEFASRADFISIGTNDLVQYIMAADRGNNEIGHLYNPYHPAVIRMIANIIKAGERNNKEISVCGELANNACFIPFLVGLGVKKLSVPIPLAREVSYRVSVLNFAKAKKLAEDVLVMADSGEIEKVLKSFEKSYIA